MRYCPAEHVFFCCGGCVSNVASDLLRNLRQCIETNSNLVQTALSEAHRLCKLYPWPANASDHANRSTCVSAQALLQRTCPSLLTWYRPLSVAGDCNCLYRSVSLSLYGTEQHHVMLRLLTAVEILSHRSMYDLSDSNCQCPFKDSNNIVVPPYKELCLEITTDSAYQDTLAAFALSKAVDRRTQMYFPQLDGSLDSSPLTRIHNGSAPGNKVVLMWSSLGVIPSTGPVKIDHFVPLVKMSTANGNIIAVNDSDDADDRQDRKDVGHTPPEGLTQSSAIGMS